jgi:HAD superfamily hydrolase (TIGR01490 family)
MTTLAFFDMDETLLHVNSANLWVKHLWETGEISRLELAKTFGWLVGYKLALVDVRKLAEDAVARLEGESEDAMRDRVMSWYEAEVRPHIIDEMAERVAWHRERGHRTVVLTASSPYVAEPCARDLSIDDVCSTRFEVVDGVFTGQLDGPMCYGDGKVAVAEAFAAAGGYSLENAWFYSDSYTDLPMLERVDNPVATNPDPRLARHARRVGMQILDFRR